MTLTELLTVMAIMALLIGIAVPAAKAIIDSFETSAGVTNVISAALANARAIAITKNSYAGVRFQQDLRGNQYMIFIVMNEEVSNPANAFRAIEGRKPMKLPNSVGVMDLEIVNRTFDGLGRVVSLIDIEINGNSLIDGQYELNDTTTFSIIFSPSGKLITRQVWIRNKDGDVNGSPNDDVFNMIDYIENGNGMFIQDDYSGSPTSPDPGAILGFGPEFSRRGFIIYNKNDFNRVSPNRRWSDYLRNLDVLYVNPHSGRIIN